MACNQNDIVISRVVLIMRQNTRSGPGIIYPYPQGQIALRSTGGRRVCVGRFTRNAPEVRKIPILIICLGIAESTAEL